MITSSIEAFWQEVHACDEGEHTVVEEGEKLQAATERLNKNCPHPHV